MEEQKLIEPSNCNERKNRGGIMKKSCLIVSLCISMLAQIFPLVIHLRDEESWERLLVKVEEALGTNFEEFW
jgi:hypothetical protein